LSLLPDEPVRCGFAGGGFGSQYAIAGGCAARINDRFHLNGAIAYSPTVDYQYGSTSSMAGRVGFSFPIGGGGAKQSTQPAAVPSGADWMNNTSGNGLESEAEQTTAPPVQPLWYRTEVKQTIAKLQDDVSSRDQQIDNLKTRLEQLIDSQKGDISRQDESTTELIAMLQQRIRELEAERKKSEEEDDRQNAKIEELQQKLVNQENRFEAMMKRLQSMLPSNKKSQ